MDFNRYCKYCGSKVKRNDDDPMAERVYKCMCRKELLSYDEVIAGYTRDARVRQLKAMHELMCMANDENICMVWTYTMPDCPSEEDFKEIAANDKLYNECFDKFTKLIAKNGNRY